jgi:hypothetical protein
MAGCSTLSRKDYVSDYNTFFVKPIGDSVDIKASIINNNSSQGSTMMLVGNTYVMVPNGRSGARYTSGNQKEYLEILKTAVVEINAFKKAEYTFAPNYLRDKKHKPQNGYQLVVRFDNVYMASDGWPTEIEATMTITQDGKIIFEKSYDIGSGIMGLGGGCMDCFPTDVVHKKLNKALFNDLNQWAKNDK